MPVQLSDTRSAPSSMPTEVDQIIADSKHGTLGRRDGTVSHGSRQLCETLNAAE
jgi:hypothetical protein